MTFNRIQRKGYRISRRARDGNVITLAGVASRVYVTVSSCAPKKSRIRNRANEARSRAPELYSIPSLAIVLDTLPLTPSRTPNRCDRGSYARNTLFIPRTGYSYFPSPTPLHSPVAKSILLPESRCRVRAMVVKRNRRRKHREIKFPKLKYHSNAFGEAPVFHSDFMTFRRRAALTEVPALRQMYTYNAHVRTVIRQTPCIFNAFEMGERRGEGEGILARIISYTSNDRPEKKKKMTTALKSRNRTYLALGVSALPRRQASSSCGRSSSRGFRSPDNTRRHTHEPWERSGSRRLRALDERQVPIDQTDPIVHGRDAARSDLARPSIACGSRLVYAGPVHPACNIGQWARAIADGNADVRVALLVACAAWPVPPPPSSLLLLLLLPFVSRCIARGTLISISNV